MSTRSKVPRILLALCATGVSLLAAEASLRAYYWTKGIRRSDIDSLLEQSAKVEPREIAVVSVFGIVQPSPNPGVVYELRPNLQGTFRHRDFSTNRLGMRGPEVELAKPADTFRIVGLGDSFMFGWGVHQHEMYSSLLNEWHSNGSLRIEFLNFGTPGYNSAMEVALYEYKARRLRPDLVLIHFIGNDLALPHLLQPPPTASPDSWYLTQLARNVFLPATLEEEPGLLRHDISYLPETTQQEIKGQYGYMLGVAGFKRVMSRLAEITQSEGVPVVLMSQGHRKLLEPAAVEHGFTFLDPTPVFLELLEAEGVELTRKNWRRAIRLPKDIHPSPFAHRAYAEAIGRHLEAHYLPGTRPGEVEDAPARESQ
jgi:hypothetical protein